MVKKKAKNALILPLVVFGILSILIVFQNCGGGAEEVDKDAKELSEMAAAPFAFDTTMNELSYLSCSEGRSGHSLDPTIFYSIKLGAFQKSATNEKAGVKLSKDFLSFVDSKYPLASNGGHGDPVKVAKALASADINKGARLQLTVRPRGSLQSEVLSVDSRSDEGKNYGYISRSLSSEDIAPQLAATRDAPVTSFTGGLTAADREVVGSLRFYDSEDAMQVVRTSLHNTYILAMTYTFDSESVSGTDQFLARAPAGQNDKVGGKVYGRGYLPHFKAADIGGTTPLPLRVLDTVDEINLGEDLTKKVAGITWTCDPRYRYKIIALKDRATVCPAQGALSPTQALEYEMVKKHLRPEYWDVNVGARCAVPRQGSCYDESAPILYTLPSEPGYASIPVAERDCGPTKPRDCVQFFSLCTRAVTAP